MGLVKKKMNDFGFVTIKTIILQTIWYRIRKSCGKTVRLTRLKYIQDFDLQLSKAVCRGQASLFHRQKF